MNKRIFLILLLISAYMFTIASYFFYKQLPFLPGALYLFFPTAASLACFYAFDKSYGSINAKAYLLIALGIGAMLQGEIVWYYFERVGTNPYPSIADFFYLSAYPIIFYGLISIIKNSNIKLCKCSPKDHLSLGIIAVILSILVSYFGIFLAYDPSGSFLENIIAMAYGVMDLGLIVIAMMIIGILQEYKNGRYALSWTFFLTGLMFFLTADILFAAFRETYDIEENFWLYLGLDSIWMMAYSFFCISMADMGLVIEEVQQKILKRPGK